jgi:protein ImuB
MNKRYISIWFRHLTTDWFTLRRPELQGVPFVFAVPDHGRMVIVAASPEAEAEGVSAGMAVADAKAVVPDLQVFDDKAERQNRLLNALGKWCIRYAPVIAVDLPDGLVLDVSGCAHLWGGEVPYFNEIVTRFSSKGYDVRAAMADTIGAAWAVSRYGSLN